MTFKKALHCLLLRCACGLALAAAGVPAAQAQFNLPGLPPATCPPNTSCVPGTPPAIPPNPPGTCGPGNAGSTCGQGGPATTGGLSGINVGAGNPINIINGNKYQREVDMAALPGVLGLEIVRHYNSTLSGAGASTNLVGRGWKLSYETDLYVLGQTVQIVQADGARIIFNRDPANPSLCASANPADGSIHVSKGPRGEQYLWRMNDGRQLSFDGKGKLTQILAPTGEFVSLQHDAAGLLVSVTDPQGRTLRLSYLDKAAATAGDAFRGVQHIDSPLGRFTYAYGATQAPGAAPALVRANLRAVNYPQAGMGRVYHYEDAHRPTLLTGISILSEGKAARDATYAYQEDGKAVLTMHAGNVNKVTLDFSAPGRTVLTNSLGQKTDYRHAIVGGQYVLLEVRGPGCATCGETDVRYAYDKLGRLTETVKLDSDGHPLRAVRTEFDAQGRPRAMRQLVYVDGKARDNGVALRYTYDTAGIPTGVARPSVVAGKEVLTTIAYNGAGQPLRVSESGWAPGAAGAAASVITRTTSYTYRSINGRSLLVRIDGPLPNGKSATPADSDITDIEWDAKGNAVLAMTSPGKQRSTLAYDNLWRIARVSDAAGRTSAFSYDARNRRIAVAGDGVVYHTRFDALDRVVETGYTKEGKYIALSKQGADLSGRDAWRVSQQGVLARQLFDSEGHLLETSTGVGAARQVRVFGYDDAGRLTSVADGPGTARRIVWNALGQVAARIDALGREQRYRYDADGQIVQVTDAANTVQAASMAIERDAAGTTSAIRAANGALTRYVNDDFGRTLVVASPDSGTVSYAYDQAGRLTASTDAHGNRASYDYDAAGRVLRQSIAGAGAAAPVVTSWTYDGADLVAIDHPVQSERYVYDDQHRLLAKTVTVQRAGAAPVVSRITYQYDATGQPRSTTLADGSTIAYQRNGQNQLVGIVRHRVRTPWLRWLLPSQTVAAGIERDLTGVRAFDYGNGVQARYERSAQGALARIVYRRPQDGARATVMAQAGLDLMLGIRPARAAVPGALGAPREANSIVDVRYLWDVQGNLLRSQGNEVAHDYAYDAQDRLIVETRAGAASGMRQAGMDGAAAVSRYFYDANGNRVLGQQDAASQSETAGTVRTAYQGGSNRRVDDGAQAVRYDSSGMPLTIGRRAFDWDALGKLVAVREDGKLLAAYRYNHRGERVSKAVGDAHRTFLYTGRRVAAELDGAGRVTRQYLYLGEMPLAVIDYAGGVQPETQERSGAGQVLHDLAFVLKSWFGGAAESLVFLHTNHLGAPEAATDAAARPVWLAEYSSFGLIRVRHQAAGFVQPLRLAGQYEDAETGLYYNDHRYYDPRGGRYLTPDPLGLQAAGNSYAYVGSNPLKFIDPEGLVLFAFDGTGNTRDTAWLAANGSSLSNVAQFAGRYTDGAAHYISGVGTVDTSDPARPIRPGDFVPWYNPLPNEAADMAFNYSGNARIVRMEEYFNDEANLAADDDVMNIDIIGFSRGAAQARDFANRIAGRTSGGWYKYTVPGQNGGAAVTKCQKVNFRFLGIWDTVLSTNRGPAYNLAIPDQFAVVSHAIALDEFRGNAVRSLPGGHVGAFPLESIGGAPVPDGKVRTERGFLGAHADIGGGFSSDQSQLAQVALEWMVSQAVSAGVGVEHGARTVIANPVVHDKSDNQLTEDGKPTSWSEDRTVRYRDGTTTTQRNMTGTGMTFNDTMQFISYLPGGRDMDGNPVRSPGPGFSTGTVDMAAYLAWLKSHGYDLNLTVQ